jgi:adenine-specific DNA-methyltransferase
MLTANAPIAKTLRPCREESVDFDTTRNLFIEGDNLDALKLLQETYLGKVKMIYIDPPYNTGNDFIYEDDFAETCDGFLKRSCQKDAQGNRLVANTEANGRFHSDWLSMMYPRLKLARNIMHEQGIVFVSIDDVEQDNLKKICGEIFGHANFIAQFVWVKKKKGSHLSKTSRSMTEYVLCYAKNIMSVELFGEDAYLDKQQPLAKRTNAHKILRFGAGIVQTTLPDGQYEAGRRGEGSSALVFRSALNVQGGVVRSPVEVEGPFIWTQDKLDLEISRGTTVFLSNRFGFNVLKADQDEKIKRPSSLIDARVNVGTNEDAYREAMALFGTEGVMSYPKPVSLVHYLVNAVTYFDRSAMVLDFFAGSSTTAHAVMQLNAEDGGNRQFIMVQLPEACDPQSEAFKAGYPTIAEISKERIRRAGARIRQENPLMASQLDIGFRVLKVDSSNMADLYHTPDATGHDMLHGLVDTVKPDRTPEDLLFQILLDWGVDLSLPIRRDSIHGREVFRVDDTALVACFDDNIDDDVMRELAMLQPLRVVFMDNGFTSDAAKINAGQIFRHLSPGTEVRVV